MTIVTRLKNCEFCGGPDWRDDPSGHFEWLASLFYEKYHRIAPGKDRSPEQIQTAEEEQETWRLWDDFRMSFVLAHIKKERTKES